MEQDHTCSEFDQLNTCTECGLPRNETVAARRSGGLGASTSALSDDDYMAEREKLLAKAGI